MSKLAKVNISQCMIVKNEEKNIEKALSWGKDIMCEQIVVDTGSTDRTVEIAKEMGADVYYFEWINDFAAAKNFAIEKAKGEWIAFLDADEYMTNEDAQLMYEHIVEYMENENEEPPDAITCKLLDIGSDGTISNVAEQNRFFRNNGVKYKGKIHEAISKDGDFFIKTLEDVRIFHTGYQKENILLQKKGKRNVEMIERELAENPDSYLLKSYLVDSLLLYVTEANAEGNEDLVKELNDRVEALTLDCMEHLEDRWSYERKCALIKVYFNNVLWNGKDIDDKISWAYEKCQKVMAKNGDVEFFIGNLLFNSKKYEKASVYYERALQKLKDAGVDDSDNNGYLKTMLDEVYVALASIYFNQDVNSQALKYMVLALQMDRFNVQKFMVLIQIVMAEGGFGGEEKIQGLFEKIYDLTQTKDKIFLYSIAKKFGLENMAQNILQKMTAEEKEIAGIK